MLLVVDLAIPDCLWPVDDRDLSDSDLLMTDERINNLVMNLPGPTPPHRNPAQKFEMDHPIMHLDLDGENYYFLILSE